MAYSVFHKSRQFPKHNSGVSSDLCNFEKGRRQNFIQTCYPTKKWGLMERTGHSTTSRGSRMATLFHVLQIPGKRAVPPPGRPSGQTLCRVHSTTALSTTEVFSRTRGKLTRGNTNPNF